MTSLLPDLFGSPPALPDGLRYAPGFLSPEEESRLVEQLQPLPFREFEFQGFLGKRRVVSFGWQYDFNQGQLRRTEDMPDFLLALRDKAAGFAGMSPADLQQVLLTDYPPGAAIGWHKDRPVFGEVVGISLVSACLFRLRRRQGEKWQRASLTAEPRSVYLLQGEARSDWEHSIPAVPAQRYSVTFRNFNNPR